MRTGCADRSQRSEMRACSVEPCRRPSASTRPWSPGCPARTRGAQATVCRGSQRANSARSRSGFEESPCCPVTHSKISSPCRLPRHAALSCPMPSAPCRFRGSDDMPTEGCRTCDDAPSATAACAPSLGWLGLQGVEEGGGLLGPSGRPPSGAKPVSRSSVHTMCPTHAKFQHGGLSHLK